MPSISFRRRNILTVATLLALTPIAGYSWSGYGPVTIRLLTVYQSNAGVNPGVLVELATTPSDTEGCTYSNQGYAWIDWTRTGEPDGKAIYASLLAAHLAGRNVNIGLNGCSSGGYPVAYGINVW